jgi:hypothetical protein
VALKVKGRDADREQLGNGQLIVQITRGRGGDRESCAGAVATAIQESTLRNLRGGDRDSAGLFQQRPSMGWGTFAQVTTPSYAINKFLDTYLAQRKRGVGWLQASHATQRSAFPSAPARWYGEGLAFTGAFAGSDGGLSAGALGVSTAAMPTGAQAYEFSRGSADAPEDTWTAAKRLGDEVNWRFFCRGGALWYVSDDWLIKQPVSLRLNEFSAGVVSLSFEYETRQRAAEATLKVLARRYAVLPGDIVELTGAGVGTGRWLVKEIHRTLHSQVTDVTLTRRNPALPEPTGTSQSGGVNVGGSVQLGTVGAFGSVAGSDLASRAYNAAVEATRQNWRYSQPRRNSQGPGGYADCSSGVSWVLNAAGIGIPGSMRPNAPVSGAFVSWGQPGRGRRMTVWCNAGHIWIQWHGFPNWRFDTGGGSGGRNWPTARSTSGFVARHWVGT